MTTPELVSSSAASPASAASAGTAAAFDFAGLREWTLETLRDPEPVREAFIHVQLGTLIRRLAMFGPEDSLQRCSGRELVRGASLAGGALAVLLARTAATHAIVEDDLLLLNALATYRADGGVIAWAIELAALPVEAVAAHLALITDREEELHVARLIVSRAHPQVLDPAWLWAVPPTMPRVIAELARCALRHRPELNASVGQLLQRQPAVLMAVEPDDLLALLVERSAARPQTVLMAFPDCFGEATVVAAARWHLEHGEPLAALELCAPIRALGSQADAARLVRVAALLELKKPAEAVAVAATITDPDLADSAVLELIRTGSTAASVVTDDEVAALAQRCPVQRPETCFAALRLLLGRQRLDLARAVARQRQLEPWTSEPLRQTFAVLLKPT